MSGLQFDDDDASEVELAGSLSASEVPVSKGSGTAAAGWSGAVMVGCFLGRPTEHFSG